MPLIFCRFARRATRARRCADRGDGLVRYEQPPDGDDPAIPGLGLMAIAGQRSPLRTIGRRVRGRLTVVVGVNVGYAAAIVAAEPGWGCAAGAGWSV
jgi:hypothetical protein